MSDLFDTPEVDEAPSRLELLYEERIKKRAGHHRILMVLSISLASTVAIMLIALLAFKLLPANKTSKLRHISRGGVAVTAKYSTKDKNTAQTSEVTQTSSDKKVESIETTDSAVIKQISNVLIVGIDDSSGSKQAKGILLAKIDILNGAVQAVSIPDRTYLDISGLGMDQISATYTKGLDLTKKTVEGLLQVQADSYITLHYPDFEYLVGGDRFQVAFDRAVDSSFSDSEKKAYSKEVAKIDASKVKIAQLPVRFISINGVPYYEPNYEEIGRLVESMWGIKMEVKTETTRVIILNGSGEPGVGRAVSDKLRSGGFIIVDVKNASNFYYKKTTIVTYKENYMEKAKMVQRILGTGDVVYHSAAQDIAEIAVVVGQDFKTN